MPGTLESPQQALRHRMGTCYQVHGVELDGVLLAVPFRGHCNGQGLAGNSKELGLGSFQLPVVQVYLKATLKDQMKTSQGSLS